MTSFKTYRLEEICDIQIGKTPRRENRTYWGKGFPWVSISDIKSREIVHTKEQITKEAVEESGCKLIPKGTLLLSFKLSIGKMAFAGTDLYTNEAIAALLIKKPAEIHPWYLFYALRNTRLVGANNAAMGATLNKESLKAIRLPIPDKFEDQLHIVNVLSKADELVAQRNETILLLDEFLKSSFLNMFGDPSSNKKKFPVGTIRDLVTEVKYGTSKSSGLDGKYPYLRMNNISYNGRMDYSDVKRIDIADPDRPKYLVRKGDLLFNRTNSRELVGKTGIVNHDSEMVIAGYLIRVRTNERANPWYVWGYLNSDHGKKTLFSMSKAIVGMANINAQEFQDIRVLIPPRSLQDNFAKIIQETEVIRDGYLASLSHLNNLLGALNLEVFGGTRKRETEEVELLKVDASKEDDHFKKRKALACYIINRSLDDEKFGDTKFEKLLFLSDYDAIRRNLGQNYYQKVAGPYDNTFTNTFYLQIQKSKWFKRKRSAGQTVFAAGVNHNKSFTAKDYFSHEELKRVDALVRTFKNSDYEKPEIIATLYAVWNNRIIRQQPITDELLKDDFLKWDVKKAKYKGRLDNALAWMRKEGLIPNGWGKAVELPRVRSKKR